MPIYEYRCSACGHELEALQKFADAKLLTCPACHADTLVKKVSAAGFQLKGSGWYVTDFRNGSKTAAAPKTDAKPDGDNAKSETSAEAPAAGAKGDAPATSDTAPAKETTAKPAEANSSSNAKANAKTDTTPAKPAKPAAPASGSSSS
jgi:putative FmdB family regulatory protein